MPRCPQYMSVHICHSPGHIVLTYVNLTMQTQRDEGDQDPEASSTAAGCVRLDNQLLDLFAMLGDTVTYLPPSYEAVPITGLAETVQESFQSILGQEQLEILTPFPDQYQQPVTHRGCCILPVLIIHVVSASR